MYVDKGKYSTGMYSDFCFFIWLKIGFAVLWIFGDICLNTLIILKKNDVDNSVENVNNSL